MIYKYIYSLHLFSNIYCTIWVVTVLLFELVLFIWQLMKWWFSYLEKKCEETVQLLSCCLWNKKKKRKKIWTFFSYTPRQKKPYKCLEYNFFSLMVKMFCLKQKYLFCNLFVIIYLFINYLSVYLCIYLFNCLCICVILVQGGGVSEQKGTKRLVESLFQ